MILAIHFSPMAGKGNQSPRMTRRAWADRLRQGDALPVDPCSARFGRYILRRRRRARSSVADAVLLGNRTTPPGSQEAPGGVFMSRGVAIAARPQNGDHSASSGRMAPRRSRLVKISAMGTRDDHLTEAEGLERQAEIADNAHARAALLRMAQASRGAAALLGLFEASYDEALTVSRR